MNLDEFAIKLGDRVPSDSPAPEDPLEEFSELEMGLLRYCHDGNRTFWFEINGAPIELEGRTCTLTMDPDLSFLLGGLPAEIGGFLRGESLRLTFGERCLSVQFVPAGDTVEFTASSFGRCVATKNWVLKKADCDLQWSQFLNDIVSDAVATGFLAAELAEAFLAGAGDREAVKHGN